MPTVGGRGEPACTRRRPNVSLPQPAGYGQRRPPIEPIAGFPAGRETNRAFAAS